MADSSRGVPRREFLRAAVAIGGASALGACLQRTSRPDVPTGPSDLSTLPDRQFAWNDALASDDAGNTLPPHHRVLLLLSLDSSGPPTDADRQAVESALRSLERAYERSNAGLLFTAGYSPAYFDRFDAPLPDSVDLPPPRALASFEDPMLDAPDAILYLASDRAHVVLAAEQAMRGENETLNGVSVDAALTDVFSVAERRTGFKGGGLPAQNQDTAGVPADHPVPDDAQLYMGFKSSFTRTQAPEDRVAIRDGPFADGTTQHVSHMRLNLDQWYGQDDRYQRVGEMFCPYHAANGVVEGRGDNLGTSAQMERARPAAEAASSSGVVGHSQKMFRVREDGRPIILRRDFDSTDGDHAGLHFVAFQRAISDFEKTREAMNGTDLARDSPLGQRANNGILQYIDVTHRGNYLVPPRGVRALPTPEGADA